MPPPAKSFCQVAAILAITNRNQDSLEMFNLFSFFQKIQTRLSLVDIPVFKFYNQKSVKHEEDYFNDRTGYRSK